MEFIVREDGLLTERSAHELALWYDQGAGDQDTFEAHLMMVVANASLLTSAQRGRRAGMSRERYSLLRTLYQSPEKKLLFRDIGRNLGVSPTSITKLVDGLERQGLVRRFYHPRDKRRQWCELTPEGAAAVEESLPGVIESTKRRWQGLTMEEKRTLIHLLAKVAMSAQAAGQTTPAGDDLAGGKPLGTPA